MGGVETDNDGKIELEGLYAAGECACVSVHGANRLGGHARIDGVTDGKRSARHRGEWALAHTTGAVPASSGSVPQRGLDALPDPPQGERPWKMPVDGWR